MDNAERKNTEITKSSISNASSYKEIGEFWDNNSLANYWEETEPVEATVNIKYENGLIYYALDENLYQQIAHLAERQGQSPKDLINLWIKEKLKEVA